MSLPFTSPYLTSPYLSLPHFSSPHVTSLHLMSLPFTSCHFPSPHVTSLHFIIPHFTLPLLTSLLFTLPYFASLLISLLPDDRLGRLKITRAGLSKRNRMVYTAARRAGARVVVTMGGGYDFLLFFSTVDNLTLPSTNDLSATRSLTHFTYMAYLSNKSPSHLALLYLAFPCCVVLPHLAFSYLVLPHLAFSYLVLPCLALPCLALPCLALPCLALPYLTLPYLTLP
jgi:hypothetical protein